MSQGQQSIDEDVGSKDSQKPWESEKVPNLAEDWDNQPEKDLGNEAEAGDILEGIESMDQPSMSPSSYDPRPKEFHDVVTTIQQMTVTTYKLSQKTEILTITTDRDPNYIKVVKRQITDFPYSMLLPISS